MKRVTVDMAAQATGLFDVHRFRQHTKKERESAWHAFRALGVGGSDMSTILGLNPYSTPYELWLEKTNRQQPEDISGKWAIVKGNALEVELRRRFRQLHPEYQVIDGTDISLVSKQHPLMHASLDGFVYDEASDSWGVLEIKTANANRGRTDWHDETASSWPRSTTWRRSRITWPSPASRGACSTRISAKASRWRCVSSVTRTTWTPWSRPPRTSGVSSPATKCPPSPARTWPRRTRSLRRASRT